MILSVGFCILFVDTCATVLAETQAHVENNQDGSKHDTSDLISLERFEGKHKLLEHGLEYSAYDPAKREKRSTAGLAALLIRKGINAVKYLTKGAYEIPSKQLSSNPSDNTARQFVKSGTFDRALNDFIAVKPIYKSDFTTPAGVYGMAGRVGDRLIYVKGSHEVTGKPTVEIFQIDGLSKGGSDRLSLPAKLRLTDIITYVD